FVWLERVEEATPHAIGRATAGVKFGATGT
ncbi:MAG: hypothetical protein QG601_918, partial [Pseudomonadota bacterium]|nr:hypothetical protein [Pseudomonadota bacterium]